MSVARNQSLTYLRLARTLRLRFRTDPALPARIQTLLSRDRTFGSRDRRLYRELLYTTVRCLPWIEPCLDADSDEGLRRLAWLVAEIPATAGFRAEFRTGEPPAADPAELLPGWFRAHCPEIFTGAGLAAQLRRAPLWLRLQADHPADVLREFEARGWRARPATVLPSALGMPDDIDVTTSDAYRHGLVEVQDLGSQLLLETIGVEAGCRWLDACAGAGGKTLQLARMLGRHGAVEAHDVRLEALAELENRARRAGFGNIRTTQRPTPGGYDGVLVDAPCSGSGTWRRSPHLKWCTNPATIAERAALQRQLLAQFAACVQPGGRLVYATCSLSPEENERVVAAFLERHPQFHPEPFFRTFDAEPRGAGLLFLPSLHDTDGFFVASLRRSAD
jgi:16S rRNA (cytosine967-C5)-methyltransferase